ncbi:MAG: tyrosine-type recombinase/integrase, partial [Anaerolineales bacterium]
MSSEFPFYDAPPSPRLDRWRSAFEQSLQNHFAIYNPYTAKLYRQNLQYFFFQVRKLPWQITTSDIQSYIDNLILQGKKPATVNKYVTNLSILYKWCLLKDVDPLCDPNFNPTAGVVRYITKPYGSAVVLTKDEVHALLKVIRAEPSILSLRDYAFTLTRLLLGDSTKALQTMRWGNLAVKSTGTWFTYQRKAAAVVRLLPDPAWQAIRRYLEASGRLPHIQNNDFIFAPLIVPVGVGLKGISDEWDGTRYLESGFFSNHYRRFARLAGIPKGRVTMTSLKNTAIMLFMDSGASFEELMAFTASDNKPSKRIQLDTLEQKLRARIKLPPPPDPQPDTAPLPVSH